MDTKIYGKGYADTKTAVTPKGAAGNRAAEQVLEQTQTQEAMTEEDAAVLTLSKQAEEQTEEKTEEQKEVERLQEMLERLKESAKAAQEQKKNSVKKRLNYNYRRVSANIMRAKNLAQTSNALSSANSNLSALRRKSVSGQYDSDEINIAITHAKRMIRTARKKLKHMKYEARVNNQDTRIVHEKESKAEDIARQRVKEEVEREVFELKKQLKSLKKQRENADRRNENMDLMIADMEYLRKKIDLLEEGKGDFAIAAAGITGNSEEMNSAMSDVVEGQSTLEQQAAAVEAVVNDGAGGAGVDVLI